MKPQSSSYAKQTVLFGFEMMKYNMSLTPVE